MKTNRVPVSTIKTGCVPFNRTQKAKAGYKIGDNPVKKNGFYVSDYDQALEQLRDMDFAGWRDFGTGNSQSAHKAIAWILDTDASILLAETDTDKRVELYKSLTNIVEINC